MTWSWRTPPAIVAVSVLAACAALLAGAPAAVLAPVALAFLIACPGLALAPLIGSSDGWGTVTLVVSISVALDLLVAVGLMYAGVSSERVWFGVLANLSLLGAAAQLWLRRSRP